jgi:hypothetical protein
MPVCEADFWRMQYFEGVHCPPNVRVPTEDNDAWAWFPEHNWVYDKLSIAKSQGLDCGPHGVAPKNYPVFSKPIINLKGMGVGSGILRDATDYEANYAPGHFWMTLLDGEHVSTDCAIVKGEVRWWRHTTGVHFGDGMFDYWTIHAKARPDIETYIARWIAKHLPAYTGMMNFETIGGRIIEAHLRFADQWPDLYGKGWVKALIALYEKGVWEFADNERRDGYSVVLFGKHGNKFSHPSRNVQDKVRGTKHVKSLQITFDEDRRPEDHAAPPGGFRLAIVNTDDLAAGLAIRKELAKSFPTDALLLPS